MKKAVVFILALILSFPLLNVSVSAESIGVSAAAAIVICHDTGEVLYSKNCEQKLPMASTTKIMTALILAEQPDLSKTVVTTKQMVTVEGSSMGLLEGDTVSYRDLLYGMLLASGNDAANTTAIALGGGVEGFAKMMNNKAKELGLKNTSFVTPSGLDDENHYTTAYDLALLTSAAIKNDVFREACSSKTATLYYGNPPYKRTLTNHNKLLGNYDGIIGVKTGFTKKAGRCLVTAAERDGKTVIAVTLNAPDDWNDHRAMLDYGLANTETGKFDNLDISDTVSVISGDCDAVSVRCESISICTAKSSLNKITKKVLLPRFIYGGVSAGEKIGEVQYYLENKLIKSADIYVTADVKKYNRRENFSKRFWDSILSLWNYA